MVSTIQKDSVRLRRIAYHWGNRGEESCKGLWNKVPPEYKSCKSFSDFWDAYQKVIDSGKHQCVRKQDGQTNHIERWNNTLRQRVGRFVRKTLSFSKTIEYHLIALRNFIFNYNGNIYDNWVGNPNLLTLSSINTK